MNAALIEMNNEASRIASERLLSQLRDEGLTYRLWVTGTAAGSVLHLRVVGLTARLKHRLVTVLKGRGLRLDIHALAA